MEVGSALRKVSQCRLSPSLRLPQSMSKSTAATRAFHGHQASGLLARPPHYPTRAFRQQVMSLDVLHVELIFK